MKIVALAGASGVVGSRVLPHLLARDDVARVFALGRRSLAVQHPKLDCRVVDLQSRAELERELARGVSLAICCLGTTLRQAGSKQAFRAVDHDAVVAFAEAALVKGAERFVLVSSLGADPRARSFYARTKGEAEQSLERLGYRQLIIVRPSMIDDQRQRPDHRLLEQLFLPVGRAVFSVLGKSHRYAPIPAESIATALVLLAFAGTGAPVRIVESDELHALARQSATSPSHYDSKSEST